MQNSSESKRLTQELTLEQFLQRRANTQKQAAEILDCSQVAISQMLRAKREIVLCFYDDGSTDWYEIKRPKKTV